jgi:succinate-semialdehyde dehydrogenase
MKSIAEIVKASRAAQAEFERFGQEKVDAVVRGLAKVVYDNAESLAKMAVEETRMGNLPDKIKKKLGKSRIIWNHLKGKPSRGILRRIEGTGIVEIAKPMGVIGAITPCTNPVVTPMCNAMYALKCGNSIIIAPHPRAKKCAVHLDGLYKKVLLEHGAPADLYQTLEEPSVELTNELIKIVDIVVATGGMAMVKAAYSSGHPAFGVGTGNVQTIVDRDADFPAAVDKIITGRIFDNGIICSAEQTAILPREKYKEIVDLFVAKGAYYTDDPATVEKLRKVIFPEGVMNKDLVGQSAEKVAELAGIKLPEGTKLIVLPASAAGRADILNKEKMAPVLVTHAYDGFKEAVRIAQANLDFEGRGHSVSLHSNTRENIDYAGLNLKVSRIVVNQICSTMNGGSFFNGLAPTTTLGTGSWGNNSISENLDYKHLMNVSRVASYMENWKAPTDDEIWGQ